jgi:dipeptidyl-peptidase-4
MTGTHDYTISPGGTWAFHTYSRFDTPPVVDLVRLPDHARMRLLGVLPASLREVI